MWISLFCILCLEYFVLQILILRYYRRCPLSNRLRWRSVERIKIRLILDVRTFNKDFWMNLVSWTPITGHSRVLKSAQNSFLITSVRIKRINSLVQFSLDYHHAKGITTFATTVHKCLPNQWVDARWPVACVPLNRQHIRYEFLFAMNPRLFCECQAVYWSGENKATDIISVPLLKDIL